MQPNNYNYLHFDTEFYNFNDFQGPKEGEQFIDFDAYDLQGNLISLSHFMTKPIVLEFGSLTCHIYNEKIPTMNKLAQEFPDSNHLVFYTREAHPGKRIGPHKSNHEKIYRAIQLVSLEPEERTILVDDVNGNTHQAYGGLPNMLYIIDTDGTVIFKDHWSSPDRVRQALTELQIGNKKLPTDRIKKTVSPHPKGSLKTHWRVMRRAGRGAFWDFVKNISRLIAKGQTKHFPK